MATIAEIEAAEVTSLPGLTKFVRESLNVENPVLYDLGCGKKKAAGFLGVDRYAPTDVNADLFAPEWDFAADDSVDMFFSSHFVEHVPDLNTFMGNAWKKLKNGGAFLITTPYGLSVRAWQDPDHKRPIFRELYWYFNKDARTKMGVDHYEGCADFDIVQMWPVWNRKYAERAQNNPDLAETYLNTFGAVDDLTVLLKCRK